MIFLKWRQRIRRSRAISMLSEGIPVLAAAHKLGYSTISVFIPMFQSATAATPNTFRGLARDEAETSS